MKRIQRARIFLIKLLLVVFWIYGCNTQIPSMSTPFIAQPELTPFFSFTPSPDSFNSGAVPTSTVSFNPSPTPSPTPYVYIVVKGDTYTSIAFQHGVKVADLIAANPEIDPNFLTIGISITIPILQDNPINQLNPTPIPIRITSPNCYRETVGGLWCLAQITNTQKYDVESISAEFNLSPSGENNGDTRVVVTPLYVLSSGSSIPVAVYYPPPITDGFQVRARILSVIPKSSETTRYLTPIFESQSIQISDDGESASVAGTISILENQDASQIWVVGIAYGEDGGNPVGFRKWTLANPVEENGAIPFDFNIYSLGPKIDRVVLLAEVHPSIDLT